VERGKELLNYQLNESPIVDIFNMSKKNRRGYFKGDHVPEIPHQPPFKKEAGGISGRAMLPGKILVTSCRLAILRTASGNSFVTYFSNIAQSDDVKGGRYDDSNLSV
jgi:hypothetical protein